MSSASEQNPQVLKKAQSYFHHGNEAAGKGNLDYAISMFREACKLVPGDLNYRMALRGVQRKKFNNDPAKVGRLTGTRVKAMRMTLRGAKSKGKWAEVMEGCEDALAHNPWDVGVSRDAAEAAEGLGFPLMAKWLMDSVAPQAGEDPDYFRHLGHVFEINHDFQRAIQCWEKVRKLAPSDENASRQINALSANATIARSGMGQAAFRGPAGKSGPELESFSPDVEEMAQLAMAPEQRFLGQIEAHPERVGPYLELSDHYRMQGRLDEAEKVLSKGLKAIPDDSVLEMARAEVQISRLHKAIEAWGARAAKNPDDLDARGKHEKLRAMLNDYEVKEFRRRAALRPDDLSLQLQLGIRLARVGQHDAAIAAFQQARSSPELRVQALLQAGISFEANGSLKLAERHYSDAQKIADPADMPTLLELNYRLGRVSEAQGDARKAEEYYNEVAAHDYGYLDVARRLRDLNQDE